MKYFDIRARMLVAALVPVTLVALLMAVAFLVVRSSDYSAAHSQRARALILQVAAASEYGLFSANISNLHGIAKGAMRDADVRSVLIRDVSGVTMVTGGSPGYKRLPRLDDLEGASFGAVLGADLFWQPVMAVPVPLDDAFEASQGGALPGPALLGQVVIEFSRERLAQQEFRMMAVGLAVSLVGLLLGCVLAVQLGRGVVQPILRVSKMVERIGGGDLTARNQILPHDPLRKLQADLNCMAEGLQLGREDLEIRIRAATAELQQKKDEAEAATLAKSRFLAAASHDLRQPTHALGMFVARLAQLPGPPESCQLVENLEAAIQAMQDLLDGLLDVSRLDAGAVPVNLKAMPLNHLFDTLREAVMASASEKRLRLRVRATSLWVTSDPVLLHRILLNLLGNAIRYTSQGTVLLSCRLIGGGKWVRIEVWDSGVGIAPEHQQDVFREFYQVGNSGRDRTQGMGLGLNIVERTARLLGHPLALRSNPGCGSRFTLELPVAQAQAEPPDGPHTAEPVAQGGLDGLRVLVIEDDAMVAQGLAGLLESWGCEVAVARGKAEALALLPLGRGPDVIISDYRLGRGENGIDVIAALHQAAGRPIAACLMSGDTDQTLIVLARETGLTLLHKPVRPAKLRSLLRHLAASQG